MQQSASFSNERKAPVTDRVNVEPNIVNGMTMTEAQVVAGLSLLAFSFIGALVWLATGVWQIMLVIAIFGPGCALWFGSLKLQKLKRNKPDGHYTQTIVMWMIEKGFMRERYITHDGYWDVGRSLELPLD